MVPVSWVFKIVTLYQGSPNYDPQAKSGLRSHFIQPMNTFCQKWKNKVLTKHVLIG